MKKLKKAQLIATIFATVAAPIIISIIGYAVAKNSNERSIEGKFVELAVGILQEKPTQENRNLRNWAVEIVNNYSGVKMTEKTKEDLIERVPITQHDNVAASKTISFLFMQGDSSYYSGDYEQSIKLYKKALNIAKSTNDHKRTSRILNDIGLSFRKLGNIDSSLFYYFKAAAIDETNSNYYSLRNRYYNISNLYRDMGQYEKAQYYGLKVFNIDSGSAPYKSDNFLNGFVNTV